MARSKVRFHCLDFSRPLNIGKPPAIRFPCMTPSSRVELPPKPRRDRPTYVMREIRQYQKTTGTLIPKTSFQCLVKEIADDYQSDVRFQSAALEAILAGAEDYLVSVFEDTKCAADLVRRETIQVKDMALALRVRGDCF